MPETFDVIVIGGGIGGTSCAIRLARGGRTVALIERETQPHHKVCGEFLSGEGLGCLRDVGIDIDAMGASSISKFRLHGPHVSTAVDLPVAARGLSRLRLDEELMQLAVRAGAVVYRGQTVTGLAAVEGRYQEVSATSMRARADIVVCATGKTDFKPAERREGRDNGFVGFKLHLRLAPDAAAELADHVELFVFRGGYAGLCHIDNGLSNLCFLIDRESVKGAPRSADELLAWVAARNSSLSKRLLKATPEFAQPVTIARVPYGFVRSASIGPSVYAIGDQAAVIPSLTGDGMSIALWTARRAAEHILAGGGQTEQFHAETARFARPQVGFGFALHRFFRQPRSVDVLAAFLRMVPGSARWAFEKTRVPEWVGRGTKNSCGLEVFTGTGA